MTEESMRTLLDATDKNIFNAQELLASAMRFLYEVRIAKEEEWQQAKASWISVQDRLPTENKRVVVRTTEGATYFLHLIGNKFPDNIKEWYELPE